MRDSCKHNMNSYLHSVSRARARASLNIGKEKTQTNEADSV